MKVILFGGAELRDNMFLDQLKLIEKVFNDIKPKQILHIPFARPIATEVEWDGDWFNRHIGLKGITYLNAQNKQDVKKAKDPLIFMSGGGGNIALLKKVKSNPELLKLVLNASCIVGESAGAKVLGAKFRTIGNDPNSKLMKGFNIVKDTIIEPHYTERKREKLLDKDLKESKLSYGIGIDCVTAIVFDTGTFPTKYKKIGKGNIYVKTKQ